MSDPEPTTTESAADAVTSVPLLSPRGGVPPVIDSPDGVLALAARLREGTGPVAIDAERASGYRYSQRAQLVQLHRRGVGIALIDPISAGDLSAIGDALADTEWVLHAAVADLACLAEIGMRPSKLFDTELGGRIAGFERVALGTLTENLLGLRLAKGHSDADWSVRPLPNDYLVYAALDVDVLLELRDKVEAELAAQGKLPWAQAEFDAVRLAEPPPPRLDPWRRTSGLRDVKTRRGLAVVRALWQARDTLAESIDQAPGRVLNDRAISGAGIALPSSMGAMLEIDGFTRRAAIKHRKLWWEAVREGMACPESALPRKTPPRDPNAAPSRSMGKDNDVADRYALLRTAVLTHSEAHTIPPENLIPPAAVRALAWDPPSTATVAAVAKVLSRQGAREWQVDLVAPGLAEVLASYEPRDDEPEQPAPAGDQPAEATSSTDPPRRRRRRRRSPRGSSGDSNPIE